MKTRLLITLAAFLLAAKIKPEKQMPTGTLKQQRLLSLPRPAEESCSLTGRGFTNRKGRNDCLIDTTVLHLQKAEIDAGMNSVRTRISSIIAQNDILDQQIENQNVNIARIEKMLKDDAATQKQYDDLTGQVAVLKKQIAANNTQKISIASELAVYESKKATLNEQITRSCVKSPLKGTIIEKYSEAGEVTAAGKTARKNCRSFRNKIKGICLRSRTGKD